MADIFKAKYPAVFRMLELDDNPNNDPSIERNNAEKILKHVELLKLDYSLIKAAFPPNDPRFREIFRDTKAKVVLGGLEKTAQVNSSRVRETLEVKRKRCDDANHSRGFRSTNDGEQDANDERIALEDRMRRGDLIGSFREAGDELAKLKRFLEESFTFQYQAGSAYYFLGPLGEQRRKPGELLQDDDASSTYSSSSRSNTISGEPQDPIAGPVQDTHSVTLAAPPGRSDVKSNEFQTLPAELTQDIQGPTLLASSDRTLSDGSQSSSSSKTIRSESASNNSATAGKEQSHDQHKSRYGRARKPTEKARDGESRHILAPEERRILSTAARSKIAVAPILPPRKAPREKPQERRPQATPEKKRTPTVPPKCEFRLPTVRPTNKALLHGGQAQITRKNAQTSTLPVSRAQDKSSIAPILPPKKAYGENKFPPVTLKKAQLSTTPQGEPSAKRILILPNSPQTLKQKVGAATMQLQSSVESATKHKLKFYNTPESLFPRRSKEQDGTGEVRSVGVAKRDSGPPPKRQRLA
ncbi:uncharacterized protein RCO7_06493 [Rhynchosporium graminicola]|uniref:Uncharacterized protein n=1 Tax=Rhynchosporium graminicola TaxID=2792576 RepID=A0A1E1KA23_9HELO|nr:uncharacterized protein RCO7_06493 [Rhynchosporium commune]